MGKRYDLTAAYKQCPLHEADSPFAVIAIGTGGEVEYFVARVLPFGACGSVLGFNRAAMALRACVLRLLRILCLSYDDYPVVTEDSLACITDWAFKELFKLLGWDLKGGEKDLEFSQKFEVLGVTLDVGEVLDRGRAVVDNSEKRKQRVVDQIAAILRSGTLSSAEAEQLCGRLGFAASQLFARIGSAAIWHLRRKADLHEGPAPLAGPLATSLEEWAKAVVSQAPRTIFLEPRGQVVVCCSDGFLDGEGSTLRAGVGAIIADRETGTFEAFGVMLPQTVLRKLCTAAGTERVIAEVELLAVMAAKKFWRAHLGKWAGRRVAFYVDNEGARYGLIKGYSPNRLCASLLSACWRCDADSMAASWYERVPTRSNCADGPSRLRFENLPDVEGRRVVRVDGPSLDLVWT